MGMSRILLVDDDRLILALMGEDLRKQGYEIHTSSNGEEAVLQCETDPPDLAILDVCMPGMSGIDAARQLRERTDVPYMFLSAYGDDDIVRNAVDEGALGYLVKPVDVAKIIPSIEAALARAKELRSLREREAHLSTALAAGRESSMAVGIIMERYRLDRRAAFEALRFHARSQRRKLDEVAAEFVQSAEKANLPAEALGRAQEGKAGK
jgi:AmiR/NasT family two-component response regulator